MKNTKTIDLKQNFDSYLVKFWVKKNNGFWMKDSRVEYLQGKDKHNEAANLLKSRYLVPIEIISVTYQ